MTNLKIYQKQLFVMCAFLCSLSAQAQTFVPVNVTGFNHDLIANGSGGTNRAAATTTITFDGVNIGGDNVMYSKDFRGNNNPNTVPTYGLPVNRIITSVNPNLIGAIYTLAHYDSLNALVLKNNGSAGTLKLETPGVFSKIAFLGSSAEGASNFNVTLNFSDGTNTNASFTVPDWYFGSGFAVKGIGRVTRTTVGSQLPDIFTGDAENPRLYDNQITLNAPFNTKILTSITFTKTSSAGSTAILAINGITAVNAPAAPVATAATSVAFPSFTANWLASSGATNYVLDISTSPTFSTLLVSYNNFNVGNVLNYQINGLVASQTYYYRVRAVNAAGVSASSNSIDVPFPECPPGGYSVFTQAQVDSFLVLYPNCKQISGNLNIADNSSINNLNGFINIERITSQLNIVRNVALTNLDGLQNIISVGGNLWIDGNALLSKINNFNKLSSCPVLFVGGNKELIEISGFDSLSQFPSTGIEQNEKLNKIDIASPIQSINGSLKINNCKSLKSITAFGNVAKINGSLIITNNDSLTKLDAFSQLTTANDLSIQNNAALANLDALNNLNMLNGSIEIVGNSKLVSISGISNIPASHIKNLGLSIQFNALLSICDLPNICTYLQETGPRTIVGNAAGCDSEQTVKNACSPPAAPVALAATNVTFPGFTANWQASAGATEYFLDVSTSNTFANFVTGYDNRSVGNVTNFAVSGLSSNTTHYYRVRASKTAGVSPNSNTISVSFAQCPLGDVTVNTQAQVDNFKILYPNCIQITGNLNITDNSNITNLNGFSNLENVTGQINIIRNSALANLDGLQNLKSVGGNFWIADNSAITKINTFNKLTSSGQMYIGDHKELTEISGYISLTNMPTIRIENNAKLNLINITNSLTQINGIVNIINNPQLQSINALGNVPIIAGTLTIENNALLSNLIALSQLTFANEIILKNNASLINLDQFSKINALNGSLHIIGNNNLNSISGLTNIPAGSIKGTGLTIQNNPALAICELPNICTYLDGSGQRFISGNAPGCNSEQAVQNACDASEAPEIPIALPATNINASGFTAHWQTSARATSYAIDVSTSGSFSTILPAYNNLNVGNNVNALITGLTNNQTYFYRIRAVNNKGNSANSNVISVNLSVCFVSIPNANFKNYLVQNTAINTNGNTEIECSEAELYTGLIDCNGLNIADLSGIEAFINIKEINCSNNLLANVDLSQNTKLEQLNCSNNLLQTLDLNGNLKLRELYCFQNQLNQLNLKDNTNLETIDCNDNNLNILDFSKNNNLIQIWCYNNKLLSLNLANGINEDMSLIEAFNNPDLTCIQVDDEDYSKANWRSGKFKFDAQHIFSEKCDPCTDPSILFISNFLVSGTACTEDSIRLIEYGFFQDSIQDIEFLWDFGNNRSSNERDPIIIYTQPGKYAIVLKLKSSICEATINKQIEILNCAVLDGSKERYSSVFPNPSFGPVQWNINLPYESNLSFKLLDLNGKVLFTNFYPKIKLVADEIPQLKTGIYIVELIYHGGTERHKIIIY
ncbi:MAG: fibronectin type III domain-containing protein [Saprospiraceae bacterium]